jgi:biopolymer transport protein ExbD/biopolymer transport protein TolR
MNASVSGSRVSEINVTPLIDILLVLLIIFMVIVPVAPRILEAALPLPPKSNPTPPEFPQTIVVQVLSDADGNPAYKINDSVVVKASLEPELAKIFATRADKVMFVQGDRDLAYSKIAEVIDLGKQAGVDTIGISTRRVEVGQ